MGDRHKEEGEPSGYGYTWFGFGKTAWDICTPYVELSPRVAQAHIRTFTSGLNSDRSSESAPIRIHGSVPVRRAKFASAFTTSGYGPPTPAQSGQRSDSCSMLKLTSTWLTALALPGIATGTTTVSAAGRCDAVPLPPPPPEPAPPPEAAAEAACAVRERRRARPRARRAERGRGCRSGWAGAPRARASGQACSRGTRASVSDNHTGGSQRYSQGVLTDGQLLAWRCFVLFGKRPWMKWTLTALIAVDFGKWVNPRACALLI
jgi:hypothetical protein